MPLHAKRETALGPFDRFDDPVRDRPRGHPPALPDRRGALVVMRVDLLRAGQTAPTQQAVDLHLDGVVGGRVESARRGPVLTEPRVKKVLVHYRESMVWIAYHETIGPRRDSLQAMPQEFLLRPLHSSPAYAAVVDRVRRAVALGALLPGDRLPPERVLAEALQVSRVTVREALRVLQGEGVLITKRGSSGTIVSPSVTSLGVVADDDKKVAEVFELRLAVETMAAQLAAERAAPEGISALDTCQEALEVSSDVHTFRRADSTFHLTIARMSGNAMLLQVVEDARTSVFSQLDRLNFPVIFESSIRGHAAVIDAIKARDPVAAATAMAAHIEEARDEVLAVFADGPAGQ